MLRTGLSGTNWTGKTETICRFVSEHPGLNVETVSLSALVAECPFPMIAEQTFEGSQWMVEQVRFILTNSGGDIQVFDRTPLDILAFTLYVENRANQENAKLIHEILGLVEYFDSVFYIAPSDDWPTNVRKTENEITFALQIDHYIHKAIDKFAIEVVPLPWNLTKRQQLLSEYLLSSSGT